ncbi:MAG: nucleotidyltransferase family protein [Acidobacteria bacterium]|nr:nucleotidyltransferase family protein [Acidobacteriota bacterium]
MTESSCDALLREAVRLGVFAAVYSNLRQAGYRPRNENELDRRWQASGARNLFLKREQERVLTGLRDAGVACLPVRGVALTEALYPDVFWREIADIDLLIAPEDVSRAYRVLKAMGLGDAEKPWTEPALERLARRASYHFPEIRMTGHHAVAVELHWDWVAAELPDGDLFLDPEACLVYLSRHAAKHLWLDLRWLADIELFLRERGTVLNWDRF